ncbi:ecdysone-induced protein 74EF-like [Neocloeon triangulifer]|uniref:ecdysone-induced protein 74EF-like n=1 Tax=Neocloeon triangulifer TaxID=2078957 RepID=UPI00286F42B7|nr:ecdysone-induced protein 74EF-like [Neocloeon triangulifer]
MPEEIPPVPKPRQRHLTSSPQQSENTLHGAASLAAQGGQSGLFSEHAADHYYSAVSASSNLEEEEPRRNQEKKHEVKKLLFNQIRRLNPEMAVKITGPSCLSMAPKVAPRRQPDASKVPIFDLPHPSSPAAQKLDVQQNWDVPRISTSVPQSVQPRKGSLQLWQFLVTLLEDPGNRSYIVWTGRGLEFKLIDAEEVASRWGVQKNLHAMNYDKLHSGITTRKGSCRRWPESALCTSLSAARTPWPTQGTQDQVACLWLPKSRPDDSLMHQKLLYLICLIHLHQPLKVHPPLENGCILVARMHSNLKLLPDQRLLTFQLLLRAPIPVPQYRHHINASKKTSQYQSPVVVNAMDQHTSFRVKVEVYAWRGNGSWSHFSQQ